jgi:hypothetical protein
VTPLLPPLLPHPLPPPLLLLRVLTLQKRQHWMLLGFWWGMGRG